MNNISMDIKKSVHGDDEPYIDLETGILHWCGWKYKRIEDEPQTIIMVKDHGRKQALEMIDLYHALKDEPQTDCAWR